MLPLYYDTVFKQEMYSLFQIQIFQNPVALFFQSRFNLTGKWLFTNPSIFLYYNFLTISENIKRL